jgi:alkylhydroperoxidase family enzyme
MSWVSTIHPDDELIRARSLLSSATEGAGSGLGARRRALVGFLVASLNRTAADEEQARGRLITLGVPAAVLDSLARRRYRDLEPGDAAIARYVHRLTIDPGGLAEEDIEDLREVGLGDREILDLNNRVAFLNYTNRVTNGLGLFGAAESPVTVGGPASHN